MQAEIVRGITRASVDDEGCKNVFDFKQEESDLRELLKRAVECGA